MPPRTMRSICARALVAVALFGAGAAGAQTAVLYGLLDASGSSVKPVGIDAHTQQLDNGNLQRSFIGIRGSEDLGAYPYDQILSRLRNELDGLIARRVAAN